MLKPSIYVSDDIRHTALNSRVSEDDGTHLSRPDLDVEVVPLVGDLEYFGPGEAIDAQFISVDEQAAGTNPQHDLHSLRILTETHRCVSGTALHTSRDYGCIHSRVISTLKLTKTTLLLHDKHLLAKKIQHRI